MKNDINVLSKSNKQKTFFVGVLKVSDENSRIRIRIRMDPRSRIHTKMSWISNTDSRVMSAVFREIEVKVMSYQDDLENGEKGIKAGWSIQDQVHQLKGIVSRQ